MRQRSNWRRWLAKVTFGPFSRHTDPVNLADERYPVDHAGPGFGLTDGIPLIHVDDRIGTPGTRSKGPFHRATAVNRSSIDGIGLKAAVAPEEVARLAVPGHTRPVGIDLYGEFRLVQRIRRYRNRNDIPTQSGRSCFRTVTMSAISSSVWDESLGKSRIMSSTRG